MRSAGLRHAKKDYQEIHVRLNSYTLRSTTVAALAAEVTLSDRSTHL
jgi:hypothetical protein